MNHPKGRQSAHACTVAPLASSDWTPEQAVPAWVAVVDDPEMPDWDKPLQRAGLFDPKGGSEAREATTRAMVAHGLRGSDSAPILKWGADPQAEAQKWFSCAALVTTLSGLPWVMSLLWCGSRKAFGKSESGYFEQEEGRGG